MRNAIGLFALVVASVFVGWSWGSHKRTDTELNSYYYPALYAAMITVVDSQTRQPIDFEIRWLEPEPIDAKDEEPTWVAARSDKSQLVTLTRKQMRKEYSFQVTSSGYQSQTVTLAPIWTRVKATHPDEIVSIQLVADGNPTNSK